MIDVVLYSNMSDDIYVDKNITEIKTITGSLVEGSSLINISLLIEDDDLAAISQCNYIYIPVFGRYYYVNNPKIVVTGMWRLDGHVDVLMSYKDKIRSLEAIIAKNENEFNLLLNDSTIMSYSNPIITTKKFPNGFGNDYDLVLTVLGGAGRVSES